MKQLILCLLISCLTAACGWQLRGSATASQGLERIYLSSTDEHGPLTTDVRQQLITQKVIITETASEAPVNLRILDENMDRRTAAVGADALTSAYELFMTVGYEVRDNGGELLTPRAATASITRTYNYNPNDAASSAREEALVLREMRRDLAQQLIRRVSALYNDAITTSSASESVPHAETAP